MAAEVSAAACLRACLKNHFRNLQAPLCGIFYPHSVAVARYAALIRIKSPQTGTRSSRKAFFRHALAQICVTSGCLPGAVRSPASFVLNQTELIFLHTSVKTLHAPDDPHPAPDETPAPSASHTEPPQSDPVLQPVPQLHPKHPPHKAPG